MLAQKRDEVRHQVAPRPRRRRRAGLLGLLFRNRMVSILVLAAAFCFVLTVYVSAYARVAEQGYKKSDLQSYLRALKIENQELRVQRDILRQPDRITELAIADGMVPSRQMAYVRCPVQELWVAENTTGHDAR